MQYLLTQEELDALKATRGIERKKFDAANVGLREDLLKIAQTAHQYETFGQPSLENPMVREMRKALDKFQKALE